MILKEFYYYKDGSGSGSGSGSERSILKNLYSNQCVIDNNKIYIKGHNPGSGLLGFVVYFEEYVPNIYALTKPYNKLSDQIIQSADLINNNSYLIKITVGNKKYYVGNSFNNSDIEQIILIEDNHNLLNYNEQSNKHSNVNIRYGNNKYNIFDDIK